MEFQDQQAFFLNQSQNKVIDIHDQIAFLQQHLRMFPFLLLLQQ